MGKLFYFTLSSECPISEDVEENNHDYLSDGSKSSSRSSSSFSFNKYKIGFQKSIDKSEPLDDSSHNVNKFMPMLTNPIVEEEEEKDEACDQSRITNKLAH